ncbi:hypothetical protein DXG03_004080 [Asterophora parasitica]|uniref:Uncharacterized protein n=1 Tax=Asterophora parasitica TaxID=117018 RepID=A0A9P7GA23_9AGAR|nr:hypothetical protein DXG03_004080 [Asterophora parasitica]
MLHCLPANAHDPFGRPILLVELLPLDVTPDAVKPKIVQTFERLRRHLRDLNASATAPSPILQYVVLLDLQGLSLKSFVNLSALSAGSLNGYSTAHSRSQDVEVLSWTIREIIPRFPGMLGGDYGGALSARELLDDPLWAQETPSESMAAVHNRILAADPPTSHLPAFTSLSPTSLLNPFFGYPATVSYGSLALHHGRRRKRDLAKTLALLFWIRWRKPLVVGILLAICAIVLRLGTRAHGRSLRSFLGQKSFISFKLGFK